jgi:protein SCO1/2
MVLRITGIAMLLFSMYIIWYSVSGDRPRNFWTIERLPENSVYLLPGNWQDQDNNSLVLSDFAGKVSVVTFVFVNCQFTCPYLVGELKKVESGLPDPDDPDLQFLIFLFDDIRGDQEAMQDFLQRYEITRPNWRILTGSPEDLNILTDEMDLQYKVIDEEKRAYLHTNFAAVIGKDGMVVKTDRGFQAEESELVDAILEALKVEGDE